MYSGNVLIVDDDNLTLHVIRQVISRRFPDICLFEADSGEAAYQILSREKINILITDLRMPEMDGIELLASIAEMSPGIKRVLITADHESDDVASGISSGIIHEVVPKPWRQEDIIAIFS